MAISVDPCVNSMKCVASESHKPFINESLHWVLSIREKGQKVWVNESDTTTKERKVLH